MKHFGEKHKSNVNITLCGSISVKADVKLKTDANFIFNHQRLLGETPNVYTKGLMKVSGG